MIRQYHKFALAAGFGLAMALTFSCSSDDGNDNPPPPAAVISSPGGSSSPGGGSGDGGSSSSVTGSGGGGACPNAVTGNNTVSCGGQTYRTVFINGQTWMAENLNYNATNSRCYGDDSGGDSEGNCSMYGRLYSWATAMDISSSYNSSSYNPSDDTKYRGVCPEGWHIPNHDEWGTLINSVGGSDIAGRRLKATSGWSDGWSGSECGLGSSYSYQCDDAYDFSAMPGGCGGSDGRCGAAGKYGAWWSASEYYSSIAYYRSMYYRSEDVIWYHDGDKSVLRSVRCLKD